MPSYIPGIVKTRGELPSLSPCSKLKRIVLLAFWPERLTDPIHILSRLSMKIVFKLKTVSLYISNAEVQYFPKWNHLINTWLAIIAGDSFPTSPSPGHLGQRNLCQKLLIDSSSCGLVSFSLTDLQMELKIAGHSKVSEQLGHDKLNGSQPRYLQFMKRIHKLISFIILFKRK